MPADSQAFMTEWKGKDLEGMFPFHLFAAAFDVKARYR